MKRKTTKFLSLALGASIMLGLAACGAEKNQRAMNPNKYRCWTLIIKK